MRLYRFIEYTSFMFRNRAWNASRLLGLKQYELTDHLGNVNVSVLDRLSGTGDENPGEYAYLSANISSFTDYYPYGMVIPGRSASSSEYRFGLNGIERTDEVAGKGNHYTAFYGEYNPRTATRWNLDPKSHQSVSPYLVYFGNPIFYSDVLLDTPTRAAVAKAEAIRISTAKHLTDIGNLRIYHKAADHIRKEYEFDKFGNHGNVTYNIELNEGTSAFSYTPKFRTIGFFSGNLDYSLYKPSTLGVTKSFAMNVLALGHEHVHNFQQFVMKLNDQLYNQAPERELLAIEFSLYPNDGHMRGLINEYLQSQGQSWDIEFDDRLSDKMVQGLKDYAQRNYNRLATDELKEKYTPILEKILNRKNNENAVK